MKFVGDSEPNFGGASGGEKIREFHSIKFVGDSEPNFWGTSGGEIWGFLQHFMRFTEK